MIFGLLPFYVEFGDGRAGVEVEVLGWTCVLRTVSVYSTLEAVNPHASTVKCFGWFVGPSSSFRVTDIRPTDRQWALSRGNLSHTISNSVEKYQWPRCVVKWIHDNETQHFCPGCTGLMSMNRRKARDNFQSRETALSASCRHYVRTELSATPPLFTSAAHSPSPRHAARHNHHHHQPPCPNPLSAPVFS